MPHVVPVMDVPPHSLLSIGFPCACRPRGSLHTFGSEAPWSPSVPNTGSQIKLQREQMYLTQGMAQALGLFAESEDADSSGMLLPFSK